MPEILHSMGGLLGPSGSRGQTEKSRIIHLTVYFQRRCFEKTRASKQHKLSASEWWARSRLSAPRHRLELIIWSRKC